MNLTKIVLLAFILRSMLFLVVAQEPSLFYQTDSPTYELPAINLLAGHGFSWDKTEPFTPDIYRTPVYPLLIASIYAVFGQVVQIVSIVQLLASSLTIWLCYLMGQQIWSDTEARLSALLLTISPISIMYAIPLLSDTLFSLLFLISIYAIFIYHQNCQQRWLVSGGVLMGLAILCRPIVLFYPLLIVIMLVYRQRYRWRDGLLYLVVVLVMLTPWVARNYAQTGVVTVSAISNLNLLYYNAANLEAHLQQIDYFEMRELIRQETEAELAAQKDTSLKAEIALYTRKGMRIILAHPRQYLYTHLFSDLKALLPDFPVFFALLGLNDNTGRFITLDKLNFNVTAYDLLPLLYLYLVFLWLVYSGVVLGIIKLVRQRNWLLLSLLLLPIIYLLLIPGAPSTPRFRLPAMPYLCLISAFGLISLWRDVRPA